jgi:hypothetical protein
VGGARSNLEEQPHAKQIAHALEPTLPSPDAGRDAVQSPAMANGRCRMHGGRAPGAPKGNSHAFKHGRCTAEDVAERRELMGLVRHMKGLVEQVDG